ncbi:MAG: hypothetical protein KAT09_04005, partial [Candidatus Aegiribacteria sp.]|nr:hypothetical protein [Candidatus Aegiribacteria sp.]
DTSGHQHPRLSSEAQPTVVTIFFATVYSTATAAIAVYGFTVAAVRGNGILMSLLSTPRTLKS